MKTATEGRKRTGKEEQIFAPARINVKTIKSKGHRYTQRWVYLPADLVDSGKFPFRDREKVLLVIEGERVIIQKLRVD
jgi:hypothetical protein